MDTSEIIAHMTAEKPKPEDLKAALSAMQKEVDDAGSNLVARLSTT